MSASVTGLEIIKLWPSVFLERDLPGHEEATRALIALAETRPDAGVFAIVLECVPEEVARAITGELTIATIGIGAGRECDGQVLVTQDLLGIGSGFRPRFVRQYANLEKVMGEAVRSFREDVAKGRYPNEEECFRMLESERQSFVAGRQKTKES